MVLVRGAFHLQDNNYTLKLESTAMGTLAVNLFTPDGCNAVISTIHSILIGCPIDEEPEKGLLFCFSTLLSLVFLDEGEVKMNVEVEVSISDSDTVLNDTSSVSGTSSNSSIKQRYKNYRIVLQCNL